MSSLYKRMVNHSLSKQKYGSCRRKVPYQTESDVFHSIAQIVLDQNLDPANDQATPYKCPYCRYWHFTSNTKGQ